MQSKTPLLLPSSKFLVPNNKIHPLAEPLHLLSMFYPRTIPAAQPLIYHGNFLGNNYNSNWSKRPKQQNLLSWWYANKRAPGSEFLGKRSSGPPGPPEDELQLLGKRVPGSEFLGKSYKGLFTNYVYRFLAFFDPPSPLVDSFT